MSRLAQKPLRFSWCSLSPRVQSLVLRRRGWESSVGSVSYLSCLGWVLFRLTHLISVCGTSGTGVGRAGIGTARKSSSCDWLVWVSSRWNLFTWPSRSAQVWCFRVSDHRALSWASGVLRLSVWVEVLIISFNSSRDMTTLPDLGPVGRAERSANSHSLFQSWFIIACQVCHRDEDGL